MKNEWLKIKIIRDIKNIKRYQKITGMLFYKLNYEYIITSKFSKEYKNLIELLINDLFNKNIIISRTYLNTIDFNLFVEISKLNNVNIINQPAFIYYAIENNMVITHQGSVICFEGDVLNYIKHSNNIFYLYQIKPDYARFKEIKDNKYCKMNRKNKLEKIINNQNEGILFNLM